MQGMEALRIVREAGARQNIGDVHLFNPLFLNPRICAVRWLSDRWAGGVDGGVVRLNCLYLVWEGEDGMLSCRKIVQSGWKHLHPENVKCVDEKVIITYSGADGLAFETIEVPLADLTGFVVRGE